MTILEISEQLRTGRLTCTALTKACLAAIAENDQSGRGLNSVAEIDPDVLFAAHETGALAVKLNRIKPVDEEAVDAVLSCERVLFFEEGIRSGGVGEKFALMLLERGFKGTFRLIAVPDCFVAQASTAEQLRQFGLDRESILDALR